MTAKRRTGAAVCPTCRGAGQQTVEFYTYDAATDTGSEGTLPIRCVTCDGAGRVAPATVRAVRAADRAWCRCPRGEEAMATGEFTFHDNGMCGESAHPAKHHYDCRFCGGVLQVG